MNKAKKIILIIVASILGVLVLSFIIWCNYAPIVLYPYENLQSMTIYYYDKNIDDSVELEINDENMKWKVYSLLKKSKLDNVDRLGYVDRGSDSGWLLIMNYTEGSECYIYDLEFSLDYGIIKNAKEEYWGYYVVVFTNEDLVNEIDRYIEEN